MDSHNVASMSATQDLPENQIYESEFIKNAEFSNVTLERTNLRRCTIRGGRVEKCKISDSNLFRVGTINSSDLFDCAVMGCGIEDSVLRKVLINGCQLLDCTIIDSKTVRLESDPGRRTFFKGGYIRGTDLTDVTLERVKVSTSRLLEYCEAEFCDMVNCSQDGEFRFVDCTPDYRNGTFYVSNRTQNPAFQLLTRGGGGERGAPPVANAAVDLEWFGDMPDGARSPLHVPTLDSNDADNEAANDDGSISPLRLSAEAPHQVTGQSQPAGDGKTDAPFASMMARFRQYQCPREVLSAASNAPFRQMQRNERNDR